MTQPINVVIPTRERADTLRHCLETVVAQDCDRITIWISDNASSPATREVVDSLDDPRIIYRNTGARVSMSHNYEFALSQITDGWIVMIGDDDGLLPGRLEPAIRMLEASGAQALNSETCFYNWPGVAPDEPVRLTVPLGKAWRMVDSRHAMAEFLKVERYRLRLPQTYTGGIVHADLFQRIKARRGSFFQSQIPDIYSGFAIASSIARFLYTAEPFAIAGRSCHSIGSSLFNLEKNAFLDEGLIPFHPDFPPSEVGTLTFSMAAIIFECYSQATHLHGGNPALSRQTMLARMLAVRHTGDEHVREWGRLFAAQHGLDYNAALRSAARIRRRTRLTNIPGGLRNLWNRARLLDGDPRPIANVAEAARTVDTILRSSPSRIAGMAKTLMALAGAR